jgi:hypothetical protein
VTILTHGLPPSNPRSIGICREPQATSFQSKTKLFSSLTRVDEELRQKAAVVDAEQAKAHRKFTEEESEDGRDWAADQDCDRVDGVVGGCCCCWIKGPNMGHNIEATNKYI